MISFCLDCWSLIFWQTRNVHICQISSEELDESKQIADARRTAELDGLGSHFSLKMKTLSKSSDTKRHPFKAKGVLNACQDEFKALKNVEVAESWVKLVARRDIPLFIYILRLKHSHHLLLHDHRRIPSLGLWNTWVWVVQPKALPIVNLWSWIEGENHTFKHNTHLVYESLRK